MASEQPRRPAFIWRWGVPLAATTAALVVLLVDGNRALFDVVNGWPRVTGDRLWACLTILGGGTLASQRGPSTPQPDLCQPGCRFG